MCHDRPMEKDRERRGERRGVRMVHESYEGNEAEHNDTSRDEKTIA